ncbi:hypothetical protein QAD02_002060 [Eretmocerus hayati]|uniref:Uncharacterized protein n=1 Tax=Eretmocerus hayati TaxID=131215 RepID=A0ACC2NIR0_9HYME|nr:hypothetical protein QAD02_002060 [Eretmocerus hayati]
MDQELEEEEESTSMPIKFGVGVALIVTAHFVLVRRWHNGEEDNSEILADGDDEPVTTRKNTLVPPTRIQKVAEAVNATLPEENFQPLQKTRVEKVLSGKEKRRSGIEEIFAKKTADLEMMLRGVEKGGDDRGEDEDYDEELDDDLNEQASSKGSAEQKGKRYLIMFCKYRENLTSRAFMDADDQTGIICMTCHTM